MTAVITLAFTELQFHICNTGYVRLLFCFEAHSYGLLIMYLSTNLDEYEQISEDMDIRTRRALLSAMVGKVGKRMDTLLIPLELLCCISRTEFSDKKSYIKWQKRQVSFLSLLSFVNLAPPCQTICFLFIIVFFFPPRSFLLELGILVVWDIHFLLWGWGDINLLEKLSRDQLVSFIFVEVVV